MQKPHQKRGTISEVFDTIFWHDLWYDSRFQVSYIVDFYFFITSPPPPLEPINILSSSWCPSIVLSKIATAPAPPPSVRRREGSLMGLGGSVRWKGSASRSLAAVGEGDEVGHGSSYRGLFFSRNSASPCCLELLLKFSSLFSLSVKRAIFRYDLSWRHENCTLKSYLFLAVFFLDRMSLGMDIQLPGINSYFWYEFVPSVTATAVGKTRQPTWYGVRSACKSSWGPRAYWFLSWSPVPATILSSARPRLGHIDWLLCVVMCAFAR